MGWRRGERRKERRHAGRVDQRERRGRQCLDVAGHRGRHHSVTVNRARRIERFLSQNTFVAKQFTGIEGSFVPVKETVEAFKKLTEGEYDHFPEQAFFMCGGLEDLERQARELMKES